MRPTHVTAAVSDACGSIYVPSAATSATSTALRAAASAGVGWKKESRASAGTWRFLTFRASARASARASTRAASRAASAPGGVLYSVS